MILPVPMFIRSRVPGLFRLSALLAIAVIAPCFQSTAQSKIFRVDSAAAGRQATGSAWSDAFSDLQEAIRAAADAGGGEIWVKAGVYKPAGNGRDSTFELRPGIRLYGGFRGIETSLEERNPKANRTVLSGETGLSGNESDNCYHVLEGATDSLIDGFIITRGNANGIAQKGTGGGLIIPPGTRKVVISGCTFEKNHAGWQGGAIYAERAEVSLINCTFSANASAGGGAVAIRGESQVSVENSIFSSNIAHTDGGAFHQEDEARVVLTGCRFIFNSANGNGGALAVKTGKESAPGLEISSCIFTGNNAGETGGAVHIRGALSPLLKQCRFERNTGMKGTGGLVLEEGALALVQECTFDGNRGNRGAENLFLDEASKRFDTADEFMAAQQPAKEPEKPVQGRMLPDVFAYDEQNEPVSLRILAKQQAFTVLALGDLTNPDFIQNYRNIEATANDYQAVGVQFFYVYRALLHPENNGYLQAFILQERARQSQLAKSLLATRVPWLYDEMDNQVLKALAGASGSDVFIYAPNGEERYAGALEDLGALRTALENIAGKANVRSSPNRFRAPQINPLGLPPPELINRVRFNPKTELFSPLRIEPADSRQPHYVKLRAEADDKLLETGNGRLYLGFHVDPLYQAQWDNRAEPLKYTLATPTGMVAPSTDSAPEIKAQPTDTEPREFILRARQLDLTNPLMLQVSYTVFSSTQNKSIEVTQRYAIQLEPDPLAGTAYRRQLPHKDPPRKSTKVTMPNALRNFDSNGDGQLSRGELSGNLWSRFPDMDTNKDGFLSSEEYSLYLQKR